ncbi:MAG: hypothetical protein ACLFTW_15490 [Chitinispirillaceae bacterium]
MKKLLWLVSIVLILFSNVSAGSAVGLRLGGGLLGEEMPKCHIIMH